MEQALKDGLVVQVKPGAVPRLKRYLDEQEGVPIDSVWTDIAVVFAGGKELGMIDPQMPEARNIQGIIAGQRVALDDGVGHDPLF